MAINPQKQAARKFVEYWTFNRPGSEKSGCQQYWNMLLGELLGMDDLASGIRYEVPVQVPTAPGAKHQAPSTKYLDAWIPSTRVLIEQKSRGVKLDAPQPGHDDMTPFEQAKFYDDHRPFDEKARWIVTCNFDEIWIYDQAKPLAEPEKIALGSLPKEVHRLAFLVNSEVKKVARRELEISVQAGKIVGTLYDALLKQYAEPDSPETLKALNKLCVRLVFCFYAEDADIFDKNVFQKLVAATPAASLRITLLRLFQVLDTPLDKRDKYLEPELAAFPYTNGGLYKDATEDEIPPMTEEIKKLLVSSSDFDWNGINTTIFGALFESTLNPETRRAGGMVYTSSENIHKQIDPLFLNDLERRFEEVVGGSAVSSKPPYRAGDVDGRAVSTRPPLSKAQRKELLELQDYIASLLFLDPASGSGNFLTETYTSLRRLENRIIAAIQGDQPELDLGLRVKVSINQFHGIEINDFAVTVAKTAMWITEAKMARETAEILHRDADFLPLKDYDGIVEGNALRMDWNEVKRTAAVKNDIAITVIDTPVDFRSAKVHLLDLKRNHTVVENADGVRFRFTNQVMKALSDKARDQSVGKTAHWAAVGNIERLCKASVALWTEKPRNGSTDILHYEKHGAAFSFGGSNYIAKITSKAYPGEDGVVTYSVEAISVENNFARGIADAISKKQHLDPSDESRILNFVEAVKGAAKPYSYIIGNPPFVGASMMTAEQKKEAVEIFGKGRRVNSIDYVGAWYCKAAELMQGSGTKAAFVSTNSITQGEQVAALWGKLLGEYGVEIDFAWRTFRWDNESFDKAHVHCVIIGFHCCGGHGVTALPSVGNSVLSRGRAVALRPPKTIFDEKGNRHEVQNINPYLVDAPNIVIESRGNALCDVPKMTYGNKPSDGGNLILSQEERDELLADEELSVLGKSESPDGRLTLADCVRRYVGARDFINNDEKRYCLWLKGVAPSVYRGNKEIMRRLEGVREMRLKSSAAPTRALAEMPYLFFSTPQTDGNYLLVPEVSSEQRAYVPMGFLDSSTIAANTVSIVPNATLCYFGVLTSSVHMAWMRTVCGRLEMRYRYSAAIVYNNFPWPERSRGTRDPTADEGRGERPARPQDEIAATAQGILDARALYPDSSLADLYDPLTMPPELRKAHAANDAAVLKAYGWPTDLSEPEIVSRLFDMYEKLTAKEVDQDGNSLGSR